MVAASSTLSTDRPSGLRAILWGGLIAGACDITYAFIFYYLRSGTTPVRILQSVASGALGANSFNGGFATATLGLFFHFLIAYIWATLYYLASRKLHVLVRVPYVCGVLYGALVYALMNYVVVPLSAAPFKGATPSTATLVKGLLIHMLGIGLPIALATRRYSK